MSRGRPKLDEEIPPPRQFTKVYENSDGVIDTWYYDLDKFSNGPIRTEMKYPTNHLTFEQINEALPITKRRYYNPANQKYIGYGRAKQLGLL